MPTDRSLHAPTKPRAAGRTTPSNRHSVRRAWPVAAALASLGLVGCAALPPARMALPEGLETAQALPFEGLGGGRSGRFTHEAREVSFRRMGDALSLFDSLRLDRVAVEFERAGARGRCDGRAAGVTLGVLDTPARPLSLHCRFTGTAAGDMLLEAPRLAAAGTRQAREGQARFGPLVIDIRSVHALQNTPLPLSQPAGYRLTIAGRDVAALDLAAGTPVLRRSPGLDESTRAALTQVALALGLLFDPATRPG